MVALALEAVFPDNSPGAGRSEEEACNHQHQLTMLMQLRPFGKGQLDRAARSTIGPLIAGTISAALLLSQGPTSPVWV